MWRVRHQPFEGGEVEEGAAPELTVVADVGEDGATDDGERFGAVTDAHLDAVADLGLGLLERLGPQRDVVGTGGCPSGDERRSYRALDRLDGECLDPGSLDAHLDDRPGCVVAHRAVVREPGSDLRTDVGQTLTADLRVPRPAVQAGGVKEVAEAGAERRGSHEGGDREGGRDRRGPDGNRRARGASSASPPLERVSHSEDGGQREWAAFEESCRRASAPRGRGRVATRAPVRRVPRRRGADQHDQYGDATRGRPHQRHVHVEPGGGFGDAGQAEGEER